MNNITLVEVLTSIMVTILILKVVSVKAYMFKEIIAMQKRKGQSLVEYTLILALISCVCFFALSFLGNELKRTFNIINAELQKANGIEIIIPVNPPIVIPPHCLDNHGHDNGHGRCR